MLLERFLSNFYTVAHSPRKHVMYRSLICFGLKNTQGQKPWKTAKLIIGRGHFLYPFVPPGKIYF